MPPTLYLVSIDIKTPYDVVRPKHVAKIMEDHVDHGRILAALLCEMAGLEDRRSSRALRVHILFCEVHSSWGRRSSQALAENRHAEPGKCRSEWVKKKMGVLMSRSEGVPRTRITKRSCA